MKGVRNITGISFQRFYNQYIKYAGNVGQDIVESIFSFVQYKPIPVTELVQMHVMRLTSNQEGLLILVGEDGKENYLLLLYGTVLRIQL